MRRFFAPPEQFIDETVELSKEETHHLRDVLRLATGAVVNVFDGEGREFTCSVASIRKDGSTLSVISQIEPLAPESPLWIDLAATVLNGERYDLIVQKAVELGVAGLTPIHTLRGDVRPKDAARRLDRWRRIVLEATKQCGRARLMRINDPLDVIQVMQRSISSETVLFSEREGQPFTNYRPRQRITALIGPKGGWDDTELCAARDLGIPITTLGGRILRAETAAISITTILQHRFGDLN